MTLSLKLTPFVRWYDLWVGAYVDTAKRAVYLCPLPCVGLKVEWGEQPKAPEPTRCAYCRCEVSDAEFFGNHSERFGHCCDQCLYERRNEERELFDDDHDDGGDDDAPF